MECWLVVCTGCKLNLKFTAHSSLHAWEQHYMTCQCQGSLIKECQTAAMVEVLTNQILTYNTKLGPSNKFCVHLNCGWKFDYWLKKIWWSWMLNFCCGCSWVYTPLLGERECITCTFEVTHSLNQWFVALSFESCLLVLWFVLKSKYSGSLVPACCFGRCLMLAHTTFWGFTVIILYITMVCLFDSYSVHTLVLCDTTNS